MAEFYSEVHLPSMNSNSSSGMHISGPNLPYKLKYPALVTSPTGKGIIAIGGLRKKCELIVLSAAQYSQVIPIFDMFTSCYKTLSNQHRNEI